MTQATSDIVLRQPDDSAALAMPLLSIEQMIARRNIIVEAVKHKVLKEGQDYGVIPGTERKNQQPRNGDEATPTSRNNTLLKPGAEKLCSFFGLTPQFEDYRVEENWDKGLFYYAYRCRLTRNGRTIAEGIGSANSREKKYRRGSRACPDCGATAIKRSKYPPKNAPKDAPPQFYCEARSGGCGRQFDGNDERILNQAATQDPAEACDLINTLQKMAQKRALVAATLIATNASEFFTQDVEDMEIIEGEIVERRSDGANSHPPANQPPAGAQETEEDPPDLSNDMVFMGAWFETLKFRQWSREEAEALLKGILDGAKRELHQVDVRGRGELLAKADGGEYDKLRERVRGKLQKQANPNANGGNGQQPVKGEEKKTTTSSPPPAKQEQQQQGDDQSFTPATDAEVDTWEKFVALARADAGDAVGDDEFQAGLDRALMNVAKKGKHDKTTKDWRRRHLDAIRASAFDWTNGRISQTAAVVA